MKLIISKSNCSIEIKKIIRRIRMTHKRIDLHMHSLFSGTGTSQLYLVPKSHMLQPNQSRHLLKRPANSVQKSLWFMGKH